MRNVKFKFLHDAQMFAVGVRPIWIMEQKNKIFCLCSVQVPAQPLCRTGRAIKSGKGVPENGWI